MKIVTQMRQQRSNLARAMALLAVAGGGALPPGHAADTDPLTRWHVRQPPTLPSTEDLEGVAYGNGNWVVVGENGTILSSPDGVQWEQQPNPVEPKGFTDVTFGNGLFVAVGSGTDTVVTSVDGRQWTKGALGMSGVQEILHDGTRFLALASGGFIGASTNGLVWSAAATVPNRYVDVGGLAFGQGTYVEVGYKRTGKPTDLYSSADLEQWTFRDANANQNLFNVGYGLGLFVAVGQGGTLITSPDGASWTPRDAKHTGFIWDVAGDGLHLVAAAQWGRLLVSDNGIDWRRQETGLPGHLTDVAFGGRTFVAVGWDGQIVQSDPVDPVVPGEGVRLTNPTRSDAAFSFSFSAEIRRRYDLMVSSDGSVWSWLATVEATQNPMRVTDSEATGPHRLYRVVAP